MKRLKYLFAALLLAVLAACAAPLPADAPAADGMVRISVGLQFPETTTASTRTWADVPDYGNLDLYLILFEDNGNPAANYLTQVVKAEHNPENVTGNGVEINFKAELRAQDNPVIHFIAIEKDQSLDIEWGPENVVIPRLTTSGGHDAYWQRVPLGMALSEANREAVNAKLRPVTMVRNFAKINVQKANSGTNLEYFVLEGFCVVNQFDRGTIAPYSERGGFASFLDGRTTRSYAAMKDAGYTGTRPAGAQLIHTEIPAPDNFTSTDQSIYLYERPFTATNHTYLILKARLLEDAKDVATKPSGKSTYYKLDLGTQNIKGFFEYYNLLRNFEYTITITDVSAEGYTTPGEAAHGVAFNNLTASVDTRELTKITDGKEMIYVNFISMVLVSDDPIDLCYCYLRGFDRTAACISDEVIWEDNEVGVREGDVIASWEKTADDVTEANPGGTIPGDKPWSCIRLTPKTPSDVLVSQEVMLYKPGGLSRTVTLYLRNPWKLIDTEVYSKYDDNVFSDSKRPDDAAATNPVGSAVGAPVILCFDLPDDLPKAMFPLEFLIESNRQNIENDQLGSKAVTSSPSLFDYTDQHSIQYVKTVTWEYYCPNGDPDDKANLNRLVVCNFKTITDTSLSEITGGETTLRIKNQYFELEDVEFRRQ